MPACSPSTARTRWNSTAARLEALLLYPGSRWAIFAGKLIANLIFVLGMLVIVTAVGIVLFQVRIPEQWPSLIGIMMLGVIGLVSLGTFYASMASRSRAREVLLPLLLYPMLIPVLLASMEATKAFLTGDIMNAVGAWVQMLALFDVIFLVATFWAFEFVIEV